MNCNARSTSFLHWRSGRRPKEFITSLLRFSHCCPGTCCCYNQSLINHHNVTRNLQDPKLGLSLLSRWQAGCVCFSLLLREHSRAMAISTSPKPLWLPHTRCAFALCLRAPMRRSENRKNSLSVIDFIGIKACIPTRLCLFLPENPPYLSGEEFLCEVLYVSPIPHGDTLLYRVLFISSRSCDVRTPNFTQLSFACRFRPLVRGSHLRQAGLGI